METLIVLPALPMAGVTTSDAAAALVPKHSAARTSRMRTGRESGM